MVFISNLDADLESRINAANAAVLFGIKKEIEYLPMRYALLTGIPTNDEQEAELHRIQHEMSKPNENFNLLDYYAGNISGDCKSLENVKNAHEIVKEVIFRLINDLENSEDASSKSLTTQLFEEKDIEYYNSCDAEGICPIQDDKSALYDFNEACVRLGIRKESLREGLKKGFLHGRRVGNNWFFTSDHLVANWHIIYYMNELGALITHGV